MAFFVVGVNHQTASVELREQIAFNAERLAGLLEHQKAAPDVSDLVVVSTCNRTEVYAMAEQARDVLGWLADVNTLPVEQFEQHIYVHEDVQAVNHLMRVASGLDSLMLGEPQILGQVKTALSLSKDVGVVSRDLNRIFEYAFYGAKRVRSETAVGAHAVSMGYAVAQLMLQVFSRPEQLTALVVAAGEMNSLVAKHLAEMGVAKVLICNRGEARAAQLAAELPPNVQVEIIPFDQLAEHLHRADVISSCTGSLHQVIHYADVKSALKKRRYKQMLLVDLAVPRDIDPKVESLDGVYLYGVDDLQTVIEENLAQRRQAAVDAEIMVNQLATELVLQQKANLANGVIQQYRQQGQQVAERELALALQKMQQGQSAEEALQSLSYRLTNALLHPTSVLLREAAKHEDHEVLEWAEHTMTEVLHKQRKVKRS